MTENTNPTNTNPNRWIKPAVAVAAVAVIGGGVTAAVLMARPDATTPEALRGVAAACEDTRGAWISAESAGSCLWRLSSESEINAASVESACKSTGWVAETLRFEGEGRLNTWCSTSAFADGDIGEA
ncbi:hypothetical protein [Mycobacterium avium]|uniref:hypothetical protein n=1 Tax=Mycobacterium avium TaxID=1764 RepID=UPI0003D1EBA3|nr:hypothetical protein [Mycobacterium avium]ETA93311.1 hypothetical protein O984_09450 [Mycobacterium avium 05-4293]